MVDERPGSFHLVHYFLATIPDNEYKAGDKIVNSDMETLVEPVQNPGTGASNVEINDKSHTQPNNDKEKTKLNRVIRKRGGMIKNRKNRNRYGYRSRCRYSSNRSSRSNSNSSNGNK